ncbi:MlaD family protein [Nocardia miyunensis]|uniref:MlaD family protein n=1 Tax=Nocardia miyunensis TaxID=282684 RepID=UPI0009FC8331|nr:MlaD family protein [Nocardia miyunensis]
MPSVVSWRRIRLRRKRFRRIEGRATDTARRTEVRWGIAGICGVLVLAAAIGIVSFTGTTAQRTYSADLAQAGSVRVGDDVRIAGIPVGKVKSLTLQPDRIRMTFTVADNVFLGDQTALDIRMLTVVGGYYVAAAPAGTKPLGAAVIPESRVGIPYNLTQAFQDAVDPVRGIDGKTLQQNLAALAASINRSPDSLRAVVQAADTLTGIMNTQNADISRTLSLADEYLSALSANSHVVGQLITELRTLETIVENNKVQVEQSLEDLGAVLHGFSPLGRLWDRKLKQQAQPIADAIPKLTELGTRLGGMLDSLRTLEQRLLPYLPAGGTATVDQSAATVQAADVCVPVPGGGC